ncbi:DoxX family protein [Streptomyces sp. NBC_01381]|uniref:DoxX family protein n=1 Tax=Streptomyces sp. NBC_01381 TaxID=2903845 RepID=UPI0022579B72|nr:DoxX family protein [Streptomyces sp. NBC_01381]MCX4667547.1 DoxX family protein [Streptomyces sp. NBC_01381]
MFIAYVAVTLLAAAANIYVAFVDYARSPQVIANMDRARVPRSWLFPLGHLKLAGGAGLLAGFAVPWIGVAAGAGLVLFFTGAVLFHLRARVYTLQYPLGFWGLAAAALVTGLAHRGI